jgi:hypothetical protein
VNINIENDNNDKMRRDSKESSQSREKRKINTKDANNYYTTIK